MARSTFTIHAALLLMLNAACSPATGLWNDEGAATPTPTPAPAPAPSIELSSDVSVAGYQQTVYPIVRQNCLGCHATNQSPFFAAADPQEAHDALLSAGKVNFDLPEASRIVKRLRVDRHNCWTSDCEADAVAMQNAIRTWLTLRGGSENRRPALTTTDVNIPTTLPTVSTATPNPTPTVLRFPVGTLFSPPITGATAEVSIVKFDDYSYKITKPVIKLPSTQSIYVRGLSVLLNGSNLPQNATYTRIDGVFAATAAGVQLSTSSLILEIGTGNPDKLALGFDELNLGSGPALALQRFQAVKNLIQTSCVSCHGTNVTGRPVLAGLNTEDDFKALVWNGRNLVVPGNAAGSVLQQVVAGTTPVMPPGASAAQRAPMIETLRSWINELK